MYPANFHQWQDSYVHVNLCQVQQSITALKLYLIMVFMDETTRGISTLTGWVLVHFRVTASMKNADAAHGKKTNFHAKPLFWKVVI